jgi:hypothetical protein
VTGNERDVLPGGARELLLRVTSESVGVIVELDDGAAEADAEEERLVVCRVDGAPACTAPVLLRREQRVRRLRPSGDPGEDLASVQFRLKPRFPGDGSIEIEAAGVAPPDVSRTLGRHRLFESR